MRPSLLAAIPVLVLAAGLAAADEPTARLPVDSESSRQIPALIAQLGSRDYRTREAATRALDTIGEPALTALTAAARSDIPEVADRASKLVFGIRHRLSNDAAIAGRTVALDVRDATVREVLAELEKQIGYNHRVNGDQAVLAKRVTLKLPKGTPYWQAIASLCDAAGLEFEAAGGQHPPTNLHQNAIVDRQQQLVRQREFRAEKLALDTAMLEKQQQLARIKLLQSRAAKEAEKKLFEEQIDKLTEEHQYLAGKVERLEAVYEIPINTPAPQGTVVLRPPSAGRKNPTTSTGAFRIEARPIEPRLLASIPNTELTATLLVTPEPGVRWKTVSGTQVKHARSLLGHEFVGRASLDGYAPRGAKVEELADGEDLTQRFESVQVVSPYMVRLSLNAPKDIKSMILKRVEGTISGRMWTGPTEIVAIDGLAKLAANTSITRVGHNETVMKVTVIPPDPEKKIVETILEVTRTYKSQEINFGEAKPQPQVWLGQNPLRVTHHDQFSVQHNPHGLHVTDESGKPLELVQQGMMKKIFYPYEGHSKISLTSRYYVKPVQGQTGKPDRISFVASRLTDVTIPFALNNVEVRAGTMTLVMPQSE